MALRAFCSERTHEVEGMHRPFAVIAIILVALAVTLPAVAQDGGDTLTVSDTQSAAEKPALSKEEAAKKEKELKLYSDFTLFSDSWVQRLNASHSEGRANMVIVQDGATFRARYHLIEKKSAVVRESPSRPGQYTGILRYQDTVYQCEADSEAASRAGDFLPVPGSARAVSEIFQLMNGKWK